MRTEEGRSRPVCEWNQLFANQLIQSEEEEEGRGRGQGKRAAQHTQAAGSWAGASSSFTCMARLGCDGCGCSEDVCHGQSTLHVQ